MFAQQRRRSSLPPLPQLTLLHTIETIKAIPNLLPLVPNLSYCFYSRHESTVTLNLVPCLINATDQ